MRWLKKINTIIQDMNSIFWYLINDASEEELPLKHITSIILIYKKKKPINIIIHDMNFVFFAMLN